MTTSKCMTGLLSLGTLLGCAGVFYATPETVSDDAETHLLDTYGQRFVVTAVRNHSNEGVGLVDRHSFTAHLADTPSTVITGQVDYESDPTTFTDTYRCVQARPALEARLDEVLRAHGLWIAEPLLYCRDSALPSHPLPDGRYPEAFRFAGSVLSFDERPPTERAVAIATTFGPIGEEVGLSFEPRSIRFAPELAPLLPHLSHDDDFSAFEAGYSHLNKEEWRSGTSRALPSIEAELVELLTPKSPGPVEVHAWPFNKDGFDAQEQDPGIRWGDLPKGARFKADLRIAAPSTLTLDEASDFARATRQLLFPHQLSIHIGRYVAPATPTPATYRGGIVCEGFQTACEEVEGYLVGPASTGAVP